MKYIVLVPDGMADWPISSLQDKTPLQVAHTTNMDFLAKQGMVGLVRTIPDKMAPGSEIGNLSLLGYDPQKYFSGRAPIEAAYMGVDLAEDEVAFRCNIVTIGNDQMVDYSAGHIRSEESAQLIATLNKDISVPDIKFYAGKSYRHLMVIKTPHVKDMLETKCTPPHDIMGQNFKRYLPKGKPEVLLRGIMERANKILENHPINQVRIDLKENPGNAIWLWGQGSKPQLPPFQEKYGVNGSIISAVDLVNGLGKLTGLEIINVPGVTGYYDTNYAGKAEYALESLKTKDFVFIHVEAPDEAGHNGDVKMKITCIERIDREILGPILNHFNNQDDFRILVSPDHATPIEKRTHTEEPVCFLMYGRGIRTNDAAEFHEAAAKEKGLKFDSGEAMMNYFIKRNL